MISGLRLRVVALVVLIVCPLALPGSASAGVVGLHLDPSSPVAKAYALPLGSAGQPPSSNAPSSGAQLSNLFGSGIQPSGDPPAQRMLGHATPAAYRVLEPGSGAGVLLMVLVAVVVLVCGAAGTLALHRRR